jgi:hypothetical protein
VKFGEGDIPDDLSQRPSDYFSLSRRLPPAARAADYFIHLGSIYYNITALPMRQIFKTLKLNLAFRTIVIEVTENWGANTTCMYTIAVHGIGEDAMP